jgi:hypothetical protein
LTERKDYQIKRASLQRLFYFGKKGGQFTGLKEPLCRGFFILEKRAASLQGDRPFQTEDQQMILPKVVLW